MACRLRPTRQCTSQIQATFATRPSANNSHEKSGIKPGAMQATLAEGLAGKTICIDSQITQIVNEHNVKTIRVKQTISADTMRRKVDKANAASVANARRERKRARS